MRALYGGSRLKDHAGGIERSEHTGTSLWAQATRENFTFKAVGTLARKLETVCFLKDSQVILFLLGIYTLLYSTMKFIAIDLPLVKVTHAILSQAMQIALFRSLREPVANDNLPGLGSC